jgi:hypothetical protein
MNATRKPLGSLQHARSIRCALAVVGVILALQTSVQAQPSLEAPFTRVTGSVFDGLVAGSMPAACGDFDNDGWLDLFVGNYSGSTNWLFRNDQAGNFLQSVSPPVTSDALTEHWSAACVDYDNDGWVDLFVSSRNGSAATRCYRNVGLGAFTRLTAAEVGALATEVSLALSLAWVDYDNDGHLDLFVANGTTAPLPTPDALFHNDGNGRFTKVAGTPLSISTAYSFLGTWSDYDNDGDMDLLVVRNLGAANTLFRNDGHGQFVDATTVAGVGDTGPGIGASWGDFDNDGDLDLLVANVALNLPVTPNFFYRNNGNGTFTRITTGVIAEDQDHFASSAWLDYDNDGWLDLLVTVIGHSSPKPFNRLYRNQGDGTFAAVTVGPLVTDTGLFGCSVVGDYNNDGFLDIFVTRGTIFGSQSSYLYRNHGAGAGNTNNWIKVRCVGGPSNRSAIGAKVRVKAKIGGTERWQMRQIVGNEGMLSFHSLDSLFGLGDATVVETLRVEWPSGIVQELRNVPVKQTLTIVERTELAIAPAPEAFDVTVKGPRQQRYRVDASPDLAAWAPVASVIITNANGTVTFRHTPNASETRMFFRATPE